MNANVDRIETGTDADRQPTDAPSVPGRRRIDVTDVDAATVQEYVRECVDRDEVSFEHRGARTYLLVE